MGLSQATGPLVPAWVCADLFPKADEERLTQLADAWAEQSTQLTSYGEQTANRMRALGETYTGEAADALHHRVTLTEQWLDSTGDACTTLSGKVTKAAEYVKVTKQAINVVLGALQTTSAKTLTSAAGHPNPVTVIKAAVQVVAAQREAHTKIKQLHDACLHKMQALSFSVSIDDPLPAPSSAARAAYGVTNASLGTARAGLGLPGDNDSGYAGDTASALGNPALGGNGTATGTNAGFAAGTGTSNGTENTTDPATLPQDGQGDGTQPPASDEPGSNDPLDGAGTATSLVDGTAGVAPAGDPDDSGLPGDSGADAQGTDAQGLTSDAPDPNGANGGSDAGDPDGSPTGPNGQPLTQSSPGSGGGAHSGNHLGEHSGNGASSGGGGSHHGGSPGTQPSYLTGHLDAQPDQVSSITSHPTIEPAHISTSQQASSTPVSHTPSAAPSQPTHTSAPATHHDGGGSTSGGGGGGGSTSGAPASHPGFTHGAVGAGLDGGGSASPVTTNPGGPTPPPTAHPAPPGGLGGSGGTTGGGPALGGAASAPATGGPQPGAAAVSAAPSGAGPSSTGGPSAAPPSGAAASAPASTAPASTGPASTAGSASAGTGQAPASGQAGAGQGGTSQGAVGPNGPATASTGRGVAGPGSQGTTTGPSAGGAPPGPTGPAAGGPAASGGSRPEVTDTAQPRDEHETLIVGVLMAGVLGAGMWQELGQVAPGPREGGVGWATSFGPGDEGPTWLPAGLATTYQKVLAAGEAERLIALQETTLRGLVYPLEQVRRLTTPGELHEALGLGFALRDGAGGTTLAWPADAPTLDVLRFAGLSVHDLIVPRDDDVMPPTRADIPWVVRSYARPWTGTGEAPGSTDDAIIEEFEILAEAAVAIPHLSEIWRLSADGTAEHLATYSARLGVWTATSARIEMSGTPLAHGLHATVDGRSYPAAIVSPTEHVICRTAAHPSEAGPDGAVRTVVANHAITALTGYATLALWQGLRVRLLRVEGAEALVDCVGAEPTAAEALGFRQLGQGEWECRWVPYAEVVGQVQLEWSYPLPTGSSGPAADPALADLAGIS